MNRDQVMSSVRYTVATFGGVFAGWFAARGWFSTEQIMGIITSEAFVGLVTSGVIALWGVLMRSDKNLVASAEAVPGVKGVITTNTVEGRALASAVPATTVVPAGTADAAKIATAGA